MIGNLQCVVLDYPDAPGLAGFYQTLLGGGVNQADPRWAADDFSTLRTGSGLVFAFQRVADFRAPQWPDSGHPQSASPRPAPRASSAAQLAGLSFPQPARPAPQPVAPGQADPGQGGPPPARRPSPPRPPGPSRQPAPSGQGCREDRVTSFAVSIGRHSSSTARRPYPLSARAAAIVLIVAG